MLNFHEAHLLAGEIDDKETVQVLSTTVSFPLPSPHDFQP